MVPASLCIGLVYSPAPGQVLEQWIQLAPGATVGQAVQHSGLMAQYPVLQLSSISLGVWGKPCGLDTVLRDRDRVEIYRPLKLDPKEARRLRHRRNTAQKS
jgi:uncharacterized protein